MESRLNNSTSHTFSIYEFQSTLDKILHEYAIMKQHSLYNFHNISSLQSLLLTSMIKALRPTTILEIGSSNGFSLFSMLRGINSQKQLSELCVVAVEVDFFRFERVKTLKEDLKLHSILHCIQGDIFSKHTQTQIRKISNQYDFIFIDCMQEQYGQLFELLHSLQILNSNVTICFENILSHSGAYDFYQQITRDESYQVTEFPLHNGFILIQPHSK
ncbi:MAG: O-methyltransferase [Candidatus Nanoarchaeia archaeon]